MKVETKREQKQLYLDKIDLNSKDVTRCNKRQKMEQETESIHQEDIKLKSHPFIPVADSLEDLPQITKSTDAQIL